MTFIDGDPIDAAQLTALETKLNELEARIPQVGTPGSTVIPQMYGGISGIQDIVPGVDKTFVIDYSAAKLASTPSSLILTPVHPTIATHIDFYVISAGPTSALCGAYINKSATNTQTKNVSFYYFVVTS
jgi:hypothetical protein